MQIIIILFYGISINSQENVLCIAVYRTTLKTIPTKDDSKRKKSVLKSRYSISLEIFYEKHCNSMVYFNINYLSYKLTSGS